LVIQADWISIITHYLFFEETAMKSYLKTTINFFASLFLIVLGTMQSAWTKEVELDFSVPGDSLMVSPIETNISQTQPSPLNSQPLEQVALDFGVPNTGTVPIPIVSRLPDNISPQYLEPMPPATPQVTPSPKLLPKPPTANPNPQRQQVTALRRAIIGQESAGKFWLVNPDSGALGYGQLLRENVAPWTKAALGKALTPKEFLANPDAQIKTIDHKLNEYLKRELAYIGRNNQELVIRRVASRWYSGNPKLWNNTRPQYSNGRRYPSIARYTRSVWKRYLREINNG
jgi:hypothetical protein